MFLQDVNSLEDMTLNCISIYNAIQLVRPNLILHKKYCVAPSSNPFIHPPKIIKNVDLVIEWVFTLSPFCSGKYLSNTAL